ncbi:MAG: hypothetical protein H7Z13_04425 [Ferruginibacter sp.]|nr:hypothetical protein [Ferruginibacter sp.]
MKKLKTFFEIAVFITILSLLVFAKLNHTNIHYHLEDMPFVTKRNTTAENNTSKFFDSALPGLSYSGFIVINY